MNAGDIDGKGRTIWELFNNRRYDIDSYQREYKWQTKQLVELVDDLSGKFLEHYKDDHDREEVAHYGHYFLGPIILSQKKGLSFASAFRHPFCGDNRDPAHLEGGQVSHSNGCSGSTRRR